MGRRLIAPPPFPKRRAKNFGAGSSVKMTGPWAIAGVGETTEREIRRMVVYFDENTSVPDAFFVKRNEKVGA